MNKCPRCGKEVSNRPGTICPKCGLKVYEATEKIRCPEPTCKALVPKKNTHCPKCGCKLKGHNLGEILQMAKQRLNEAFSDED